MSKKELYAAFARIGLKGSAKERARLYGIITIIAVILILMLIAIAIMFICILSWRGNCMRHSRASALNTSHLLGIASIPEGDSRPRSI